MNFKNIRTLSIMELFVCALGIGYIDIRVIDYGIFFFIPGLILEIPTFYLVFELK
jgi:hypothetical protein